MSKLKQLIKDQAIMRAEKGRFFNLSSGGKSDILIDCSKVLRTRQGFKALQSEILKNQNHLTRFCHLDAVGGPLSGSDPVAFAFLSTLSIPRSFGVRKESKNRGFDQDEITGSLQKGDNVLLVEDVCTTGGNLLRIAPIITDFGANIVRVLVVVDRGGLAKVKDELKVSCSSLFTLEDLIC